MVQQGAQKRTSERGFASMDSQKQREIASKGGRAAHQKGTAHEFDSREAAEAGKKGGQAVSQNRTYMAQIGAEGGRARALNRQRMRLAKPPLSKSLESSRGDETSEFTPEQASQPLNVLQRLV